MDGCDVTAKLKRTMAVPVMPVSDQMLQQLVISVKKVPGITPQELEGFRLSKAFDPRYVLGEYVLCAFCESHPTV
jgi:hypothetical protein